MRAVAVCAYLDGGWRLRLLGVNFLLLILGCDFASSQVLQNKEQIWHTNSIPTLAKVWPTNHDVGVSGLCHGLIYYGLGKCDLPNYESGKTILKALLDEKTAIQEFGISPFVRTRHGLRYFLYDDPIFHSKVGESHRDQCLATFAALDLPLQTPIQLEGESHSIADLLAESIANFSFDQREPAWTAIAYAKYLSPKQKWNNRFGEQTTFSQFAQHLLTIDLHSQSCAGTHILQALVSIEEADRTYSILDNGTRLNLALFLTTKLKSIAASQNDDGSWGEQWASGVKDENFPQASLEKGILITGHLAEVLNMLESDRRPPQEVYLRAAEWLQKALNSNALPTNSSFICPYTHAARAARVILRHQSSSEKSGSALFTGMGSSVNVKQNHN